MNIQYSEHTFRFERTQGNAMSGHLILDQPQRVLLRSLLDAEDECWALDDDGERLPADQLFALSPWSISTEAGTCKLLCRFINVENGAAHFNTPNDYPGDLVRQLHPRVPRK